MRYLALLRMQTAFEVAQARDRQANIKVKRYVAKPVAANVQATV